MATALGIALFALIGATMLLLLGIWRWLNKPSISDETMETLWGIVLALNEATQRLEATANRLERLLSRTDGKRLIAAEREMGGEGR
jgi:type II secretory pathway component PulJ